MENSLEVWEALEKALREQYLLVLEYFLRLRSNDSFSMFVMTIYCISWV